MNFWSDVNTVVIPSGSALSPAITIGQNPLVAVVVPANVTITFQGSIDNIHYYDIYKDSGSPQEYQVVCAVSGMQTLDINQFLAPRFIKIRIGTASSPSAVNADTAILVVSKEM